MHKSFLTRGLEQAKLAADLGQLRQERDVKKREQAQQRLARRMGAMRGLPQKLGQGLGLRADSEAFADLGEHGEALPLATVQQALSERWGRPWEEVLATIEPAGLAASLGQVHRARLHDGREVAVKLLYPGIREAVTADLQLLGWMGKLGSFVLDGFDNQAYREVLLADLEEELDYRIEARNQREYAGLIRAQDRVLVPTVIDEWSTQDVLVSAWVQGVGLEIAASWPELVRLSLGRQLVAHFLRMFFDEGLVHGDPHRGNYRFSLDGLGPGIVLFDYGCVARFAKPLRLCLLRLILATRQQVGDPFPLLLGLGFQADLLEPLRAKLPALCRVLFEPFLQPGLYAHHEWQRSERLADLLGEDRWNFRMSGPPGLIFLVRGFQGLFYYLDQLGVQAAWSTLLDQSLGPHLAAAMAMRLPSAPVHSGFASLAQFLHIRLSEAGQQKVSLKFPASSVERLHSLMGPELGERVLAQGIDLDQVIRRARQTAYGPGELFSLQLEHRELRVWLE